MPKPKQLSISDEFWKLIEPLVPPPASRAPNADYQRKPGAGRKPMPDRQAFEAIIYVLRTKTQWKSIPHRFGSSSAVHSRFKSWEKSLLFLNIWQAGLAEHDEMAGIAWEWEKPEIKIKNNSRNIESPSKNKKGVKNGNPHRFIPSERNWRPAGIRRRQTKNTQKTI